MRYIDKYKCYTKLDLWVNETKPSSWNELPTNLKHELHHHLWLEQGGLCIYCQQAIPEKTAIQSSDEIRSHIEHIRPRSKYFGLTFDYCNLSVSCEGFDCAATKPLKKEFCEHRKANEYSEEQFLHPIEQQDIEDYFKYSLIGTVSPHPSKSELEQQYANYMIKILDLNHKELTQLRLRAIQTFNSHREKLGEILNSSDEQLPEFYSMLKSLFQI